MKNTITASLLAAACLIPSLAHAQDATPTPPAATEGAMGQVSTLFVGGDLDLLPLGTIEASGGGQSISSDTAFAFGLGGFVEKRLTPIFGLGLAPRYIFNVKGSDSS